MAKIRDMVPNAGSRSINATVVERAKLGRRKLTAKERIERTESGYYNPDTRFKRVAGIRAEKIVNLCKGLRACANRSVYDYTPDQVSILLGTLDKAVKRVRDAFNAPVGSNGKVQERKVIKGIFAE